ncbi:MAG: cytochrome C oxidase subunit II [Magnetococcales bacterium]|nr:cytochrome C oxidase subunit II [Magnetococcales bacterium]
MSITPPSHRIWWKQPLDRIEGMWIVIALLWCLILFLWMPYWHVFGRQNLSNESYRTKPETYQAKVEKMVAAHTVRKEGKGDTPVVAPPPGSDVYMLARLWEWYPILELQKGQSYRLHISSLDWLHGFSLQPTNVNLEIIPGYETVITITPDKSGDFGIVCNEYCGVNHHTMLGKIHVK